MLEVYFTDKKGTFFSLIVRNSLGTVRYPNFTYLGRMGKKTSDFIFYLNAVLYCIALFGFGGGGGKHGSLTPPKQPHSCCLYTESAKTLSSMVVPDILFYTVQYGVFSYY